jgi:hypothetical protein
MRKSVITVAAMVAMSFGTTFVAAEKISGVLIDEKCAAKFTSKDNPEKAASKHKAACAASCCEKGSPMVLLSGKDELKLDAKGQELAKEYISKADANTKVTITGEKSGDEIKVASIEASETK